MAATTEEMARDFAMLTKQKRNLQHELSLVQEDLDEVEKKIVDEWTVNGTKSIRSDAGLVYIQRDLRVNTGGQTRQIAEAMQAMGLPDFVTVNHTRLQSWIKEKLYDEATDTWETFHAKKLGPIESLVTLTDAFSLGVRAK